MTHPTRVLVVDDEPAIHRFLSPVLVANDYEVLKAEKGSDALRCIASETPDLVILDLGLPDMDGKDVITQVREWSDIPIIVLSAQDREAEKVAALDRGADDFVNKPFGVGELMARLRTALRHRMQRQGETGRQRRRPGDRCPAAAGDVAGHRGEPEPEGVRAPGLPGPSCREGGDPSADPDRRVGTGPRA